MAAQALRQNGVSNQNHLPAPQQTMRLAHRPAQPATNKTSAMPQTEMAVNVKLQLTTPPRRIAPSPVSQVSSPASSSVQLVGSLKGSNDKTIAIGSGNTTIVRDGSSTFDLDSKLVLHKVDVQITPAGRFNCKDRYCKYGRLVRRQIVEFALKSLLNIQHKDRKATERMVYDDDGMIVSTEAIVVGDPETIVVKRADASLMPRTTFNAEKLLPESVLIPEPSSVSTPEPSSPPKTRPESSTKSSFPAKAPSPASSTSSYHTASSSSSAPNLRPGETEVFSVQVKFSAHTPLKCSDLKKEDNEDFAQRLNVFLQHRKVDGVKGIPLGKDRLFVLEGAKGPNVQDLGSGLVAIAGYSISVGTSSPKVTATISPCAVPCYNASESLASVIQAANAQDHRALSEFLTGLQVKRTYPIYPGKFNRIETIAGLATVPHIGAGSSEVRFLGRDGKATTVQDYFLEKHDMPLAHPELPVVNVNNKRNPTNVPAELCEVLPNQVYHGKLNADQALKLASMPVPSKDMIKQNIERVGLHVVGQIGGEFKTHVPSSGQLIAMPACAILAAPIVTYGEQKVQFGAAIKDMKAPTRQYRSWNLKEQRFATPMTLNSWTIVSVRIDGRPPLKFEANLVAQMKKYVPKGLTIGDSFIEPNVTKFVGTKMAFELSDKKSTVKSCFKLDIGDKTVEGIQNLNAKVTALLNHLKDRFVKFAIIVLPEKEPFLHDLIKSHLEIPNAIRCVFLSGSQVDRVLERTGEKGDVFGSKRVKALGPSQFFANVAAKMNLKLGGANQVIEKLSMSGFTTDCTTDNGTLYIGLDVSRSAETAGKVALSVAAGVVGTGQKLAQWPARFKTLKTESRKSGSTSASSPGKAQKNNDTATMSTSASLTDTAQKNGVATKSVGALSPGQGEKNDKITPKINKAKAAAQRESIDNLQELIRELLDAYSSSTLKNKLVPSQVIVYRNNASQQHATDIAAIELEAVRLTLRKKYSPGRLPSVTFIMVGRSHSSRFRTDETTRTKISTMPKPATPASSPQTSPKSNGSQTSPQLSNAQLQKNGQAAILSDGAVVHQIRRHDSHPEFLLQAHGGTHIGNNGSNGSAPTVAITARPTRYTVLESPREIPLNKLIEVTHALSYSVGTATQAVALCAPAHYAQLASAKAMASLKVGRLVNVRKGYFGHRKSQGQTGPSGPDDPALLMVISDGFPGNHTFVHPDLQNSMFYL